ncbi:hypothetical protein HFO41_15765 [Rhizobium leguminosarum]|uniref:hypothetical protein n=1 Tax=Rhizobium leguminosarum TaxID=384 RepID=UPI001A92F945|nr:hypothetical protein [Rhizobium leguminosarum]MBY5557778.1 hypothetical protein [Rhizobium leguminosarum]MBY5638190.1 hypothetical protein [Rhizobium leguminosarum]MBY5690268.1 hypothetical protein [Rhizobium leguminosarum]MBY5722545.1 hypothetical protein [Rhizobium leguminosarum]QSW22804.1 hypothetical protein J0664_18800 [Rhizobium leguminosarum]
MRAAIVACSLLLSALPARASDQQLFEWMALLYVSNKECIGQSYDADRVTFTAQAAAIRLGWSDDKAADEWAKAYQTNEARFVEDGELFCAMAPTYLAVIGPAAVKDLGILKK